MGLETGTYINSLNASNPLGTDQKSQGDDHIRLVKSTIKNTLPNVTGAILGSQTDLNYLAGAETAGIKTADIRLLAGASSAGVADTMIQRVLLLSDTTSTVQAQLDAKANIDLSNVSQTVTARANLGLGALAVLDSVAAAQIDAGAVGQGELKTATASQSTNVIASSFADILPTGGEYTLHKNPISNNSQINIGAVYVTGSGSGDTSVRFNNLDGSVTYIAYLPSRYVQASPPWKYGAIEIPIFILAMLDKTTKEVLGTYAASDPPHAYHGPHNLHPVDGRLDKAFGFWGKNLAERRQDPEFLNKMREMKRLKQRGGKELLDILNKNTFTMDEKNIDMEKVPHLFTNFDPTKHVVVMLDPLDQKTEECALIQELVGIEDIGEEHISNMLHGGHIQIDNTPLDIACPKAIMSCKFSMKNTRPR